MTKPSTIPTHYVRISGRSNPQQRVKARKQSLAESVRRMTLKGRPHIDWDRFLEIRKNSRIAKALALLPDDEE